MELLGMIAISSGDLLLLLSGKNVQNYIIAPVAFALLTYLKKRFKIGFASLKIMSRVTTKIAKIIYHFVTLCLHIIYISLCQKAFYCA